MSRARRSPLVAALALLALLAGIPAGGVILCVSPDGHVALEFSPAPARADAACEPASDSGCNDCGAVDGCGTCSDSGLDWSGPLLRARDDDECAAHTVSIAAVLVLPVEPRFVPLARSDRAPEANRPASVPPFLRTTVLLI